MSDDQGRPVAPHRSGGWHWVGPTREEAPSMSELIANVTANFYHTDHPLRHWDRTCPACQQETAPADGLPEPLLKHARREIEEAIEHAKHPKGMSVHDGRGMFRANDIERLLKGYDALRARLQEEIAKREEAEQERNQLIRTLTQSDEDGERDELRIAALQKELEAARGGKLTKVAQVGNTVFHVGVSEQHVIQRAQREYEYEQTPERQALRKERLTEFFAALSKESK
jgi:hypothetical protein